MFRDSSDLDPEERRTNSGVNVHMNIHPIGSEQEQRRQRRSTTNPLEKARETADTKFGMWGRDPGRTAKKAGRLSQQAKSFRIKSESHRAG